MSLFLIIMYFAFPSRQREGRYRTCNTTCRSGSTTPTCEIKTGRTCCGCKEKSPSLPSSNRSGSIPISIGITGLEASTPFTVNWEMKLTKIGDIGLETSKYKREKNECSFEVCDSGGVLGKSGHYTSIISSGDNCYDANGCSSLDARARCDTTGKKGTTYLKGWQWAEMQRLDEWNTYILHTTNNNGTTILCNGIVIHNDPSQLAKNFDVNGVIRLGSQSVRTYLEPWCRAIGEFRNLVVSANNKTLLTTQLCVYKDEGRAWDCI